MFWQIDALLCRFFGMLKDTPHEMRVRYCNIDYDREIALVAERNLGKGKFEILGVGRMSRIHGTSSAEFAVLVTDKCQNKGLGSELTKRLIEVAKGEKLNRLEAYTLLENHEMQAMCKKLGFQVTRSTQDSECVIEMNL